MLGLRVPLPHTYGGPRYSRRLSGGASFLTQDGLTWTCPRHPGSTVDIRVVLGAVHPVGLDRCTMTGGHPGGFQDWSVAAGAAVHWLGAGPRVHLRFQLGRVNTEERAWWYVQLGEKWPECPRSGGTPCVPASSHGDPVPQHGSGGCPARPGVGSHFSLHFPGDLACGFSGSLAPCVSVLTSVSGGRGSCFPAGSFLAVEV